MKYYQGKIKVSAMGSSLLKCEICGKECLGLNIREDDVKLCDICLDEDKEKEFTLKGQPKRY